MTQEHPITTPPELVQQWLTEPEYAGEMVSMTERRLQEIADKAARRGWQQRGAVNEAELQKARDEELDVCCEWVEDNFGPEFAQHLRLFRRPKPKSQAEEALEALEAEDDDRPLRSLKTGERFDIIRAALERLRELEKSND